MLVINPCIDIVVGAYLLLLIRVNCCYMLIVVYICLLFMLIGDDKMLWCCRYIWLLLIQVDY